MLKRGHVLAILVVCVLIKEYDALVTTKYTMPDLSRYSNCDSEMMLAIDGAVVTETYNSQYGSACKLRFRPAEQSIAKVKRKVKKNIYLNLSDVSISRCDNTLSVYLKNDSVGEPDFQFTCKSEPIRGVIENHSKFVTITLNKVLTSPDRFKIVLTSVIQADECYSPEEFLCENLYCVDNDVTCDTLGVNNCFDGSDQRRSNHGSCPALMPKAERQELGVFSIERLSQEKISGDIVLLLMLVPVAVVVIAGLCAATAALMMRSGRGVTRHRLHNASEDEYEELHMNKLLRKESDSTNSAFNRDSFAMAGPRQSIPKPLRTNQNLTSVRKQPAPKPVPVKVAPPQLPGANGTASATPIQARLPDIENLPLRSVQSHEAGFRRPDTPQYPPPTPPPRVLRSPPPNNSCLPV